jgi:hypothetical protein
MSAEWPVKQQLWQAGELSTAETEQARAVMAQTAAYTPLIAVVRVAVMSVIMHALYAGYYHLIGDFSYGQWFGALEPNATHVEYAGFITADYARRHAKQ